MSIIWLKWAKTLLQRIKLAPDSIPKVCAAWTSCRSEANSFLGCASSRSWLIPKCRDAIEGASFLSRWNSNPSVIPVVTCTTRPLSLATRAIRGRSMRETEETEEIEGRGAVSFFPWQLTCLQYSRPDSFMKNCSSVYPVNTTCKLHNTSKGGNARQMACLILPKGFFYSSLAGRPFFGWSRIIRLVTLGFNPDKSEIRS